MLTSKQKIFLINYMHSGNATQSYYRAGYRAKNDNCAGVQAHRMLKNVKIKKELERMAEEHGVSKEWIISEAKKVLSEAKHPRDKATLLRLLGDIEGCTKHTQTVIQQGGIFSMLTEKDIKDIDAVIADDPKAIEEGK